MFMLNYAERRNLFYGCSASERRFSYRLVVCVLIVARCSLLSTPEVRDVPLLQNRPSDLIICQYIINQVSSVTVVVYSRRPASH